MNTDIESIVPFSLTYEQLYVICMDQEVNIKTLKTKNFNLSDGTFLTVPKDIVFPNELNQYLKDQLQLYIHENGVLQKRISETEEALGESNSKNEKLIAKIREYEILCGKNEFISSSAVAASKIVELSKRVREVTSDAEVYKTRCTKLEYTLTKLTQKLQNIEQPEQKNPNNDVEEQVKQLQEKLNATKNKMLDIKNYNAQLKNDLKLANKWLQQETGENFETLNNIHNTNANWRGRAQIICDLQTKNSDLREKLKRMQDKGSSTASNEPKLDKQIYTYMKENSTLKSQLSEIKKKFDVTRGRVKYLEAESGVLKNKIIKLNAEVDEGNEEISNLTSQLQIERRFKNENKKQVDSLIKKIGEEKEILSVELKKKECAMENLIKNLNVQKEQIIAMEKKLTGSEESKPRCSANSIPDKQLKKEDLTISRLEAERLKLLELTELQCKRLETERALHHKTNIELRRERHKGVKVEAKLARLELEFSSKSSSYSTLISRQDDDVADTLRNELELTKESVEALRTRLEVEKHERKVDLQQFANILQIYNSDNQQ